MHMRIRVCVCVCGFRRDLSRDMVFKQRLEVYGDLSEQMKCVDKNVPGREDSIREGLEGDMIVVVKD